MSELKAAIFETLNSAAAIDAVVARYCRCRIDRLLKKIDFSESSNVAEITAECDRQMISINIADIAQRATDRIQNALQDDDLPTLLANYDNKAMMALAARHLKSSKLADFESWLTSSLSDLGGVERKSGRARTERRKFEANSYSIQRKFALLWTAPPAFAAPPS